MSTKVSKQKVESKTSDLKQTLTSKVTGKLDDEVQNYIVNIVDNSTEQDVQELFDVIGPLLHDALPKQMNDDTVHALCEALIQVKFGRSSAVVSSSASASADLKLLTEQQQAQQHLQAPVNLGEKLKDQTVVDVFEVGERKQANTVDREALAKELQRKERRAQKREEQRSTADARQKAAAAALRNTPMVKKRHTSAAAELSRDVRVENFDLSVGGLQLLQNASVTLSYGRHYGLVGRNGVGKSTFLAALAAREVHVPEHISILLVEQEIEGDDTEAIQSVLLADVEREQLLAEERALLEAQEKEKGKEKEKPEKAGNGEVQDAAGKTVDSRLAQLYKRLTEIEADKAPAKAAQILAGLGFNPAMQRWPTRQFSGGWRMRLSLARALFCEPDLLLLDEPTNMLDLRTVLWLENYLQRWHSTMLVVSHDRDFLNSIATDIVHMWNCTFACYKGNYDSYEKIRAERLRNQARAHEAQQAQLKHVQQFIDRFRYNAKRASLVQSRLKALAKMQIVPDIVEDPTLAFAFPAPDALSPPIIQFNDVAFGYVPEKLLFRKLQFGLDLESRVAVVGSNGQGKSTLLKLLSGELQPTAGYVFKHHRLRLAKFSQHFVDQLDLTQSALEFYKSQFPGKDDPTYRAHLSGFGISGPLQLQPMRTLSGGQKSRVAFSLLGWRRPHFMMLDEPTNHLDLETVDALSQALNGWPGGLMLVTHDERLITLVCNEMWICENGQVTVFEGDFESYKKSLGDEIAVSLLS